MEEVANWFQSNWTGFSFCLSIVGVCVTYIFKMKYHTRSISFNKALDMVYILLSKYLDSVNSFKYKVDTLKYDYLLNRNIEKLDSEITFPKITLTTNAILLSMFFKKEERHLFMKIPDAANLLAFDIWYNVLSVDRNDRMNAYDRAKTKFDSVFKDSINEITDLVYKSLYKKWRD